MKIQNKIILVVACPRTASTTLVDSIGNVRYVKSLGETYNRDPRGTFRMEAMNRNSYVDLDVIEYCISNMHNIKPSDVLVMKIFGDQISDDEIDAMLNSDLDVCVVFCKRDVEEAYKSLVRSQLTGNWGTTPEKQVKLQKELDEHVWKPDSFKYITSFNDYIISYDKWYEKMVKLCASNNIHTTSRWFCDIIDPKFDVKLLLKELSIHDILGELTIDDVEQKKYLSMDSTFYKPLLETAGINDRMHLTRTIIYLAGLNRLIPIVPEFKLSGMHNKGKTYDSNFSEYYDFDNVEF